MFRKLRNRLILINLGITTVVMVVVFTMIYVVSVRTAEERPVKIQEINIGPGNRNGTGNSGNSNNSDNYDGDDDFDEIPEDFQNLIVLNVRQEKESAAQNLLITLISSGLAIEIVVAMISYFMAEEAIKPVKEAYESQKVFIANASHEIKTPLAAISANLEAADMSDNKWIHNVEIETAKLAALNSELLTLARTDLTTTSATAENVDLKAAAEKILDSFEPRLTHKKLTRKIKLNKKVKINLTDFEQILSILMDNAVKYSESKINIDLAEHSLTISNDGKKIDAEKLPHIFDRFYQADKSTEGVGLGLAIAKSLAERNHWKLTVKSSELTSFVLNF